MRITLGQISCVSGDVEGNVAKIVDSAQRSKGSSLVIFPELSICGCMPFEMLRQGSFIDKCEEALDTIARECESVPVLVGCPIRNNTGKGKPLFNAAVYLFQGQRKAFYKRQLGLSFPDELDLFEPSEDDDLIKVGCHKFAVTIGDDLANVGDDNLLLKNRVDDLRCLEPDAIVNLGSGRFGTMSSAQRRNTLRMNVLKTERPLFFVNNVGVMPDVVYDGGSMVFGYEGYVVAAAPFFEEKVLDVDLQCLISMRHDDVQEYASKQELVLKALSDGKTAEEIENQGFEKSLVDNVSQMRHII
ncbi:MAG: nitrilase-related carbon-nitrogen hydrolase [Candidatus Limimorpha sp.]